MDVTSTIKQSGVFDHKKTAFDVLSKLNGQKTTPTGAWDSVLNQSRAATKPKIGLDAHGVTRPETLENAKVSKLKPDVFGDLLSKKLKETTATPEPLSEEKKAKLEKTSATLVNQFFMGSMLKQMRESPFKNDMFTGGKGGDAYAGLFDQRIAEHSGNRIAKSLVKSMVKQYTKTSNKVDFSALTDGAH